MAETTQRTLVELGAKTDRLRSDLNKGKRELSGFQRQVKSIAASMGAAFAAAFSIRAVTNFVKESVKAYDIQAKAEQNLLVALGGRKGAQQELIKQAKELQKITLFGDEETIRAQALIAAFTKEESQIKKIIPLVQDLASAKGMQLSVAADLVSKTLGSTTNALSRYGIEVIGAVGSSERLETLVNNLTGAFGGQAEAAAKAGTGALTQLGNQYGDLQEELGGLIVQGNIFQEQIKGLSKTVTNLATILSALKIMMAENEEAAKKLGKAFKAITIVNAPLLAFYNLLVKLGAKRAEKIIEEAEAEEDLAEEVEEVNKVHADQIGIVEKLNKELKALNDEYEKASDPKRIAYINDRTKAIEAELASISKLTTKLKTDMISVGGGDGLVEGWDELPKLVDIVVPAMEKISTAAYMAKLAVSDLFYAFMDAGASADSIQEFAGNVVNASKRIIAAYLAETVGGAVKSAMASVPFPFNLIAAGIAGGGAAALFNSLIPSFANEGQVNRPTLAMVGDYAGAASNPEFMLKKSTLEGLGSNIHITLNSRMRGRDIYQTVQKYERFLNNT